MFEDHAFEQGFDDLFSSGANLTSNYGSESSRRESSNIELRVADKDKFREGRTIFIRYGLVITLVIRFVNGR